MIDAAPFYEPIQRLFPELFSAVRAVADFALIADPINSSLSYAQQIRSDLDILEHTFDDHDECERNYPDTLTAAVRMIAAGLLMVRAAAHEHDAPTLAATLDALAVEFKYKPTPDQIDPAPAPADLPPEDLAP